MKKSSETSVVRELVGARRATVNFRTRWKRAFENAEAKRLLFGSESNLRCVFALPDDHQLLEQFERACVRHRTKIDHMLKSVGRQRVSELWVPTLVRGCKKVRVVASEPIQQEKLSLLQARAFARKCGVDELRRDWLYVIRRHASTPELLIEAEGGGEDRWHVIPFTEWAVVGCAVPIMTSGSRLRSKKWKGRPNAQYKNDAWAEKRQMTLICQSGQASLYGGLLDQVIADDEEGDLFRR